MSQGLNRRRAWRRLSRLPKSLVKWGLRRAGYRIQRRQPLPADSSWKFDAKFEAVFEAVQDHTMVSKEGLKSLYDQALFCERVALGGVALGGDFVECGVWKRGSVGVVSGGSVIIDDYGSYDGCRKAVDEFLARLEQPLFLNVVNSQIHYLITNSANPWKTVVREMAFAGAVGGAGAPKDQSYP